LPKQQQLDIVERLQQLNQQNKDLTASNESISIEQTRSCSLDELSEKSLEK